MYYIVFLYISCYSAEIWITFWAVHTYCIYLYTVQKVIKCTEYCTRTGTVCVSIF